MPYLEVRLTARLERVYDVSRAATIGRAPDSTVQILSRAVSRKHAAVEPGADGRPAIRDLGAGNGVKVNGKKIAAPTTLEEGDVVLVGDISMTYRAASLTVAPSETFDLRAGELAPGDVELAVAKNPVAFVILSAKESIERFQATIARSRFDRLELPEDARFRLAIALAEALDNAARHGCGGDPTKPIQVTFDENAEDFTMKVRDLGPGYDVDAVVGGAKEIDALEAIRERATLGPGLGLRIILDCVDRIQFEGRGSTIAMAKAKEGAEMIVISEDDAAPEGE